jgi:hypothetical protein
MMRRIDFLRSFANKPSIAEGYSGILRDLNKNKPELILPFMKAFKQAFDAALEEQLDHPDQLALMESIKSL